MGSTVVFHPLRTFVRGPRSRLQELTPIGRGRLLKKFDERERDGDKGLTTPEKVEKTSWSNSLRTYIKRYGRKFIKGVLGILTKGPF